MLGSWNSETTRLNLPFSSLPGSPKVIRICSHLRSCLEVGPPSPSIIWEVHHRINPSSVLPHNPGENDLERMLLVFVSVWRDGHPSLIQSLYQPFAFGTTLDLAHQVPSHCYNVHLELSAHHLGLCLYQNSTLVLQDNLVGIWWHMLRGYGLYIQHVNTLSNPISNFGKSLHPWHSRL